MRTMRHIAPCSGTAVSGVDNRLVNNTVNGAFSATASKQ